MCYLIEVSHVDLVAKGEEEDSKWEADWWDDGEDNFLKERSFVGFIPGDVTGVHKELHEESGNEEESKNGADESEINKAFLRNQSLVLFVHGFECLIFK